MNIFDMAAVKKEHYFYPGHKGKTGKIRPGILVIDGKYKFRYNQTNKDQTIYNMYCVQQANPEFSCRACSLTFIMLMKHFSTFHAGHVITISRHLLCYRNILDEHRRCFE